MAMAMAMATALFLNASSSNPNQTKLHSSINRRRRRIIIPTAPQISLSKIIIPTTTTAGFITTTRCSSSSSKIIPTKQITTGLITTKRSSSSSSSRASTSSFRVQCCFKEEGEKERNPNQNPFEKSALKDLPVYQIISIVLLMVSRVSPIVIGVLLLLDLCLVISSFSSHSLEKNGGKVVVDVGVVLGLILFILWVYHRARHPKRKSTVIKLQVGLLGLTPSLQKDLDGIRNWSKALPDLFNSVVERWVILPVITSSLASHLDCCKSVYSSVDVKPSIKDGEEQLNKLLIEERQKFDEKTNVNVIGTKRQSSTSKRANGFPNEYTVITILLAAIGVHELPAINDIADLKEALQKLGSISRAENMAVEVLWMTQNENGTLQERELLEHYRFLRPL